MILVDASIWIDQLRRPDPDFGDLLRRQLVVIHPYVAGEVLLGSLRDRAGVRLILSRLDSAPLADHHEVLNLIESASLFDSGIGYVDAHLAASTLLMVEERLWTRDKRLGAVAGRMRIAAAF